MIDVWFYPQPRHYQQISEGFLFSEKKGISYLCLKTRERGSFFLFFAKSDSAPLCPQNSKIFIEHGISC